MPREDLRRERDRRQRLGDVVLAAEEGQIAVVQRLHAQRDPVHARRPGSPRNRSASTEVGLASSVISMSGAQPPTLGGTVDDGGHRRRLHQRRRAAAEEDRAQRAARRQLREMVELGHQGPRPARMVDTAADMAVEVAVGALGLAERPVDVEREAAVR